MEKVFTLSVFLLCLFLFQQETALGEVSENQLVEYIYKSTYSNYKELNKKEKEIAFKDIEQNFNAKTLSPQQKLAVYSILLLDIGLDKPEAATFKAIMLYEIEKYDLAHASEPIYKMQRQAFIEIVNNAGEKLIYDKVGIEKTADDIRLENMGAYSRKKEISAAKRSQAINDVYEDYLKKGIELDKYKKVALQTFDDH